jgi:phosphate-selective porin OprO/OprP
MFVTIGKWLGHRAAACALAAACAAGTALAQEPSQSEINDLRAKLDSQQKQIEKLQKLLEARQQHVSADGGESLTQEEKIRLLAEAVFMEKEEKKKQEDVRRQAEEECKGHVVGSDLKLSARWAPENGVTVQTANDDFCLHIGGCFQQDWVWWQQPAKTRAPQDGAGHGPIFGGVTPFEDGTFFRRIRLNLDGRAWENVEFKLDFAFENFGNNTGIVGLDEFWVGVKDMPWIGTVRVGNLRVPQGLEGDLVSSYTDMTFMERASFSDAFYENLGAGIWVGNHVLCDRATCAFMAYKQEAGTISGASNLQPGAPDGAVIQDNNWAYSGRLTALPCYGLDGRELVHLGVNYTYRSALYPETAGAATTTGGATYVDFSARPEMRDTIGNYANVGPGNSKRLVDTGLIQCSAATVPGLEFLTILGPLTLQAEWAWAFADHVSAVTNPVTGKLVPATFGALPFDGGYIQAAYLLTGENRLYDRRLGRLASNGVRPYTPFWFLRDGSGHVCSGLGAWEIAARYSYLNLNDGPVQGGILSSSTFGLNWYLNNNLKIQFEYLHSDRYALPPGAIPGPIDSFGIRTQILF